MARTTLRDVVNQVIERAWEAGAQAALIHQGVHAPAALRQVKAEDPVWNTARAESLKRQQRLAREDIHRALEALTVETERQLRHEDQELRAEVDLAHGIGLEF